MPDHTQIVRESFTTQAQAFAATPWISDEVRLGRLVSFAEIQGLERVLDVATGPGYVAEAFARVAKAVVGVDLTEAMLWIARERALSRNITNLEFRIGDALELAFADGEFDVAVTRFSLHHFQSPIGVLKEMARVCRPDGLVVLEDIVANEEPARAAAHNRIDLLRDPSHVRAMPVSELLSLYRESRLEVQCVSVTQDLHVEVDHWLATTRTPVEKAEEIRTLLDEDRRTGSAGLNTYHNETGGLHFCMKTAILTGRKCSQ